MSEHFSLKWNSFKENFAKSLTLFRQEDSLYDVTLVSDDHKQISAHKLVLSASSEYFKEIIRRSRTHYQLMLCLDGVNYTDLNNILQYIYNGEIQIIKYDLERFLEIAQRFKLEGLTGAEYVADCRIRPKVEEPHYLEDEDIYVNQGFVKKEESLHTNTKANVNSINSSQNISLISSYFSDISELDNKISELISRDADGMYRCDRCPKFSKHRSHIREHVESHIGGLSFPCQHCDKTCRSRHALRTHQSSHKFQFK